MLDCKLVFKSEPSNIALNRGRLTSWKTRDADQRIKADNILKHEATSSCMSRTFATAGFCVGVPPLTGEPKGIRETPAVGLRSPSASTEFCRSGERFAGDAVIGGRVLDSAAGCASGSLIVLAGVGRCERLLLKKLRTILRSSNETAAAPMTLPIAMATTFSVRIVPRSESQTLIGCSVCSTRAVCSPAVVDSSSARGIGRVDTIDLAAIPSEVVGRKLSKA